MKKSNDQILAATADAKTVAKILGLTDKRIGQLAAENKIASPDAAGLYPLAIVAKQYCDFLRSRADAVTITSAKRRKMEASAALAEMELARKRGEWVEVKNVERVWNARKAAVREVVMRSKLAKGEQDELLSEFELNIENYL